MLNARAYSSHMQLLDRCPKCRRPGQAHPGYINGVRCDVCKGWGIAFARAIYAWELTGHGLR